MAAAAANALDILEDYLAVIEHLPFEFRHHLAELKDKDHRFQDVRRHINQETKKWEQVVYQHYIHYEQSKPKEPRETEVKEEKEPIAPEPEMIQQENLAMEVINQEFGTAKTLVDEKISLAEQTWKLLDTQIKRLDTELTKMQLDLEIPPQDVSFEHISEIDFVGGTPSSASFSPPSLHYPTSPLKKRKHASQLNGRSNKKKRRPTYDDSDDDDDLFIPEVEYATPKVVGNTPLFESYVVPVDAVADDSLYCVCQRPSFGDMVGCDNQEDCPYEWYHYECVGLTAQPVGKWYCPSCRGANASVKRKR